MPIINWVWEGVYSKHMFINRPIFQFNWIHTSIGTIIIVQAQNVLNAVTMKSFNCLFLIKWLGQKRFEVFSVGQLNSFWFSLELIPLIKLVTRTLPRQQHCYFKIKTCPCFPSLDEHKNRCCLLLLQAKHALWQNSCWQATGTGTPLFAFVTVYARPP